MEFCSKDFK